MVDSVRPSTTVISDLRVGAVARVAPSATPDAPVAAAAPEAPATLAKSLAATPPVDIDRVAQIKSAIANGTFPLSPARIADQLIALRYDWMSNDQA